VDDSFFNLPFIRDAQGPLAWLITIVSVGLMLLDRFNKWGAERAKKRAEGGKESVDRFEAVSEAEARLREVYERDNGVLRGELKALREENEKLRGQLSETKDALAEAQRQLTTALESIGRLERKMGAVERSIENGHG
jgi:chromosome segregation ATPase